MTHVFEYQALDQAGRRLSGRISAAHEREALRLLQAQGLTSSAISPAAPAVAPKAATLIRRRVRIQDYILVFKQLALLLNAAVPLVQAVATLKNQGAHPDLTQAFDDIDKKIRAGTSFSAAFAGAFPGLPPYMGQLVSAGETIGRLGPALADGVAQLEYDYRVQTEIKNALTYPAILVIAGLAAVMFIFIVVVPRFSAMMATTKQSLPALSVAVLKVGMFLNANAGVVAAASIALAAFTAWAFRDPAMRLRLRSTAARAPLIGQWLRDSDLANWASLLSTMLANGVDLIKGLQLAQASVRIPEISQGLAQVAKLVRGGKALSAALAQQGTFDETAVNLIEVGEASGELPEMLRSLATLYEDASRQRMKRFLLLLEPAAIILIGGVIGGIVVAIMLAITSINQLTL